MTCIYNTVEEAEQCLLSVNDSTKVSSLQDF